MDQIFVTANIVICCGAARIVVIYCGAVNLALQNSMIVSSAAATQQFGNDPRSGALFCRFSKWQSPAQTQAGGTARG
jgi:hypothetical protein